MSILKHRRFVLQDDNRLSKVSEKSDGGVLIASPICHGGIISRERERDIFPAEL